MYQRRIYDLCIHASPISEGDSLDIMLKIAETLNVRNIALSGFEDIAHYDHKVQILNDVKSSFKVEVHTRADISVTSAKETAKLVDKLRKKVDIICIRPLSKSLMSYALKDKRVDLILLAPPLSFRLSPSMFSLAHQNDIAIELRTSFLLRSDGIMRSKVISLYKLIASYSFAEKAPVVLSSGAKRWFEIRGFSGFLGLGRSIGFDKSAVINAVVVCPRKIIERNLSLRASKLPKGVEVI